MRLPFAAAALAALLASGCSALGLSSFPIGSCADSSDCEAANNHHRIAADACTRFVCVLPRDAMGRPLGGGTTGTCVRGTRDDDADGQPNAACAPAGTTPDCDDHDPAAREGRAEICDGIDNDCDGVVDDMVSPLTTGSVVGSTTGALAVSRGGALALAMGGAPLLVRLDGAAQPVPVPFVAHPSLGPDPARTGMPSVPICMPQRSGSLHDAMLAMGCPTYDATAGFSEAPLTLGDCSIVDAALAQSATGTFVAAVNGLGCVPGQLRVGLLSAADAPSIELRGPIARSNLFLGADGGARCTGSGVAGIALDSNGDGSRALLAFLDAPVTRTCGGGDVALRAMGVERLAADTGTATITVLDGTDGGSPATLDPSSALPDVVSVGGDDYIIGYGTSSGSVVLRRVSFPTMGLALAGLPNESANACVVNTAPAAHALEMGRVATTLEAAGAVSAVALAALSSRSEIGVAFQVGCDATAHVWLSIVRSDGSSTPPVDLGAGESPDVIALAEGVVTPGHHGASADTTGGFVVAMDTAAGLQLVRVADADAAVLEDTRTVPIDGHGGSFYATADGPRIAWSASDGAHAATAACHASAGP